MDVTIRNKFPNYIPVVVVLGPELKQKVPRVKYLLDPTVTVGAFLIKIRKSLLNIDSSDALFTLIENRMVSLNTQIRELDNKNPEFIYMHISKERTFG